MAKTIDTIILGLLLLLVIKGIWRGFKKELVSLVSYMAALLAATSQIDNGTRYLESSFNLHPILGYFVSYFVVFMVVYIFMKIMAKNILKLIQKEPTSGLVDSIGGAVFGFSVGMLIVGMLTLMLRPIPVADAIFAQSDRSLFLNLSERFIEPVVGKFMSNPIGKIPLDELISSAPGGNLILPDMMKGLLDGTAGLIPGTEGIDLPAGDDLQNIMKQLNPGENSSEKTQSSEQALNPYLQALKNMRGDSSLGDKKSATDLLKLIKH